MGFVEMYQEVHLCEDSLIKHYYKQPRKEVQSSKMAKEKTPLCNKECGQRVHFNFGAKAGEPGRSDFGKLRALQVSETGELLNEIHECPKSTYGKRSGGNGQVTKAPAVDTTTIETLLGNSYDQSARLEKIETQLQKTETQAQLISRLVFEVSNKIDQLIGQRHITNNNPLDDDGDSIRENPEGSSE